ncbi:MAG TPA: class I SAM-dependent methyltransferase [Candidatus Saccharimonadales bacterium]|nr:class I SAM-dependent methyltransferase [Candidatus Saccharimonadales bacterium]
MDHADHVALLRTGVEGGRRGAGAVWADIGAGRGAFTLALADLLGAGATVIAVDRDRGALAENARVVAARFPLVTHTALEADLAGPLEVPPLDGLVAANSLHFVARDRQVEAVRRLAGHLQAGAPFIVVEYDADRGNPWVPNPFSLATWARMAVDAGLEPPETIGRVPSRFLGAIYASMSRRASAEASRS